MQYQKIKSVAKQIIVKGPKLDKIILDTLKTISDVVGATLGPGGQPVLIERGEHDLPPMVTKDGVTAFRALGFDSAAGQCVMETTRDASVRTAAEAGDGTTTATILADSLVSLIKQYTKKNPTISSQKIVRHLQSLFRDYIEPSIRQYSTKVDINTDEGSRLLHAVAKVSANGDTALADAVIECFGITGDDGNVTIMETNGQTGVEVEKINGFSIRMGYEESCSKYFPQFVNDPGNQRCYLEKPVFILYHGRLNDIQNVAILLEEIGSHWGAKMYDHHNVVLVAAGFSDSVLANLAVNFAHPESINVFPLLAPQSPQASGQVQFLYDLASITGATVLDQLSKPLNNATLADLGPGISYFEAYRFRSTAVGYADDSHRLMRIDELKEMLLNPESELDRIMLNERIAKISGGVAKLSVIGASNGELKERRDRAEDAVCAVRGAIKHGCLPAGGWMLLKLCNILPRDPIADSILRRAFMAPVTRLLENCGIVDDDESASVLGPVLEGIKSGKPVVYDFLEHRHCDPFEAGLLDSTPAVLEAIRTSISIASQVGTLGAIVVFARDIDLERQEAMATTEWNRTANQKFHEEPSD